MKNRRRLLSVTLAVGLSICPPARFAYAEDIVPYETEDLPEESVPEEDAAQAGGVKDPMSADGLFEVVSEKQSREGQRLEDVLPQPQTVQVPAQPPSSSLTVNTLDPHAGPAAAMKKYAKEYKKADLHYFSSTLFYTCTRKETDSGFY
jgi:hypothetical protein